MIAFLLVAAAGTLTNLEMWSLIVGAVTPPLLAIVQQPQYGKFRPVIMLGAAVVDGVVIAWLQGTLDFSRFTTSALTAGVAIIAAYNGFWKPTGIAPAIESRTKP